MKQSNFDSTLEKVMLRQQEICDFCSGVLNELFNDGNPIIDVETEEVLVLPVEKLEFVIEELNAIKPEVEMVGIVGWQEYLSE